MSEIQNKVGGLKEKLKEMPIDMRLFSLTLRSLYTDKAVGTSNRVSSEFRKLRDDTRNDAVVYMECILPISTKFVMSIKEFFANYDALSYPEWCEMLPDILEETKIYKAVAHTMLKMHEDLMITLKQRQDDAKIIMTEFKDLQREYEMRKKQLQGKAEKKRFWSIALAFIPVINIIATPLLRSFANEDTAQAIAMHAQSDINAAAALAVAESLIPALSNFVEGLEKAAGFFQAMEMELESFKGRAGKGIESQKEYHYKLMKSAAAEIKSLCQDFYAALPDVRTDLGAIPKKDTDQNVVDKWLVKTTTDIRGERREIQKFFLDALQNIGRKALTGLAFLM